MRKAELRAADKAGGEHGVKNAIGHEIMSHLEEPNVVVGPMHQQCMFVKGLKEGIQIDSGQRIDQTVLPGETDLNEAELFRVGMKAVCLGVQRQPVRVVHGMNQRLELILSVNHARSKTESRPCRRVKRIENGGQLLTRVDGEGLRTGACGG